MTDLYPKLVLWRSLNGWTWLIDGPPTYVHKDGEGPLVLSVIDNSTSRSYKVTVEEER